MFHKSKAVAGFGLTLLLTLAGTANANLIINGGFENEAVRDGTWRYFLSDDVDGWDGDNIEIWDDLKGVKSFEGEQHAELNAHPYDGTTFIIYQDFETILGQSYDVSFAYSARRSNKETFLFDLFAGDLSDSSESSLVSEIVDDHVVGSWNVFNASFIGTGETTRLMFTSVKPATGTVGNFLDAVSVIEVPEPSSLALLGLGLIGLGISRRQKA